MAEKIISPGVFTNEIDQSFLPSAVADIGAALIGPTLKGPAGVPTVVTSYSDFQAKFGDVVKSGSNSFQFLTSHAAEEYLKNSDTLTVVRVLDGTFSPASATITSSATSTAALAASASFTLETLADGGIMNNTETTNTTNSVLTNGTKNNIRYEISNVSNAKGTFTVSIRAGNDNQKRKQVLESYTGVNLNPNSPNYIAKAIGDQKQNVRSDGTTKYLELTGSFPNKSRLVRVTNIKNTIDYLDENGTIRLNSLSSSLPAAGSGSAKGGFKGGASGYFGLNADGTLDVQTLAAVPNPTGSAVNFYENIGSQTQGFNPTDLTSLNGGAAYAEAIDLIANQDEFDVNLILVPGLIHNVHSAVTNKVIDACEDRGDCFTIIDPVVYAKNPSHAVTEAEKLDSNFAAMYYPWVKVPDSQVAGTQRWVPPSVVLGGIYAFNDKVAHPWFAPAGLNRGGITTAIQAQRKLTQNERDTLYDSNVNPIATFPGQGVTVFGQKTLQKRSSALDRINVRRLLIRVKKFIASSSRFLVFEQNTAATRQRFLNIVNPFLDQVQSQSGLNAFRVVMDGTNNTPDTIDRNQLIGQLFLQPTRTAEFIVLDFVVQPTGAAFPE